MANEETEKKSTVDVNAAPTFGKENQSELKSARPIYRAEICKMHAIQGVLMGTTLMNPSKENVEQGNAEPWTALVVRLTAPCLAVDKDKNVNMYHKGDEILVGGLDLDELYSYADHPTKAFEAWMKPSGTEAIGSNGNKLMRFKKVLNRKPWDREQAKLHFFGRKSIRGKVVPMTGTDSGESAYETPF